MTLVPFKERIAPIIPKNISLSLGMVIPCFPRILLTVILKSIVSNENPHSETKSRWWVMDLSLSEISPVWPPGGRRFSRSSLRYLWKTDQTILYLAHTVFCKAPSRCSFFAFSWISFKLRVRVYFLALSLGL